ncbi:MAG: extracellular solute-binding protein [Gorillibacterium sp.]|nr:extracellular solute-binding protein [Gorillibacterium sp.]
MNRTRNTKVMAACLAAVLAILPACSKTEKGADATTVPSAAPTVSASIAPVKAEPLGKYSETVEYTTGVAFNNERIQKLPAGATLDDNAATKFAEEKLNVKTKILWQVPGEGTALRDKLNVLIASNDIPDIMQVSDLNVLKQLIKNDMIEDLTSVFNDYALPSIKDYHSSVNNKSLELVSSNGKMYAIPNVYSMADGLNMVWIRADWLEKVNMKGPETIDDLAAIAKAFVEKDPGGNGAGKTIGLLMSTDPLSTGNLHSLGPVVYNYFGVPSGMWMAGADGKVTNTIVADSTKQGLAKIADWYKQGLIDKEFALRSDDKNNELVKDGKAGIMFHAWWGPFWPLSDPLKLNPQNTKADWKPFVIKNVNGKVQQTVGAPSWNFVVVKKGFKHPELAMKLVNLAQEVKERKYPEMSKLMDTEQKDGGYKDSMLPWPLTTDITSVPADEIIRSFKMYKDVYDGVTTRDSLSIDKQQQYDKVKKYMDSIKDDPTKRDLETWADYRGWGPQDSGASALANANIELVFSAFNGTTETIGSKKQILDDKARDAFMKIIIGKESIDYFDSFVKEWNDLGGKQMTDEVNQAAAK